MFKIVTHTLSDKKNHLTSFTKVKAISLGYGGFKVELPQKILVALKGVKSARLKDNHLVSFTKVKF